MPIMSYLAYPKAGRGRKLAGQLRSLPACEVFPSSNHELLILVTDTEDEAGEQKIQQALDFLEDLECLAMVFGHDDTQEIREDEN